jgi:DNA-binding response OmpR family regulator
MDFWYKNAGNRFKEGSQILMLKILIADDEFLIRWSLSQALNQEGYEVISVEDGEKAIEALRIEHFDCLITDLVMPGSDGWQVLETLRYMQSTPRVIVMTPHGQEDTGRLVREKGGWAYVEKPYIIEPIKGLLRGM